MCAAAAEPRRARRQGAADRRPDAAPRRHGRDARRRRVDEEHLRLLLGIAHEYRRRDEEIELVPGETLVLHTDGVTDVRGRDGRFGEERLRAALHGHRGDSPTEMLAGLDEALTAFQVGARPEDIAMIALRRQPSAGGGDCTARLPGTGLSTAATIGHDASPARIAGADG